MLVYRNTEHLPPFRNAVLTIGTFDGVHTGHQQVIAQMKKRALEVDGETVIVTFDPHPRTVVRASDDIRLINTLEEKIELLKTTVHRPSLSSIIIPDRQVALFYFAGLFSLLH